MNILVKNVFKKLNYKQIGSDPALYFDPENCVQIRENKMQIDMWTGCVATMKLLCNKFYLNIDSTIRFINKRSIWNEICHLRDNQKLDKTAIASIFD